MLKLFAFALFIAGANAFWSACSDLPGTETASNVQGATCIFDRCISTRGTVLTLDIFFTPQAVHTQLATDGLITHAQLPNPAPVTFNPPNDNACSNLYHAETRAPTACPTVPGTPKLWIVNMNIPDVPAILPAITGATLRMTMTSNNVVIGCTNIRIDVL